MSNRTLIDPVEPPKVDSNAVIQEAPAPAPAAVEGQAPDELQTWAKAKGFDPSMDRKYLEMYRNLESDHGRLRNEVGESRQLIDRVLQMEEQRLASDRPSEDLAIDATELLSDTTGTLDKYFEAKLQKERAQYESRIKDLESQVGTASLTAAHSDAAQIANSPEFLAFVQASPSRVRVGHAAVAGDVGALNDLLTEYKSQQAQAPAPTPSVDPGQAALQAAQAAQLESSASSGGTSDGKIYSRQALIRMKIEDPEAYGDPAFQEDLKRAYVEKRVR